MRPSVETVRKLLEKLVSPNWKGIVDYKLEYDDGSTGNTFLMVDVIFDMRDYWVKNFNVRKSKAKELGQIYDTRDMDYQLSKDVKSALKYLGVNNSIVEVYVIEEN